MSLCQIRMVMPYSDLNLYLRSGDPRGVGLPGCWKSKGDRDKDNVKAKVQGEEEINEGKHRKIRFRHPSSLSDKIKTMWATLAGFGRPLKPRVFHFYSIAWPKVTRQFLMPIHLFWLQIWVRKKNGKGSWCDLIFIGRSWCTGSWGTHAYDGSYEFKCVGHGHSSRHGFMKRHPWLVTFMFLWLKIWHNK